MRTTLCAFLAVCLVGITPIPISKETPAFAMGELTVASLPDDTDAVTEPDVAAAPISETLTPPPILFRALSRDMRGSDVQALQQFLAQDPSLYPEGLVTGYFGELTQRAVERFQCRNNIVCSGTPKTTGYGRVGPQTRVAINPQSSVQGLGLANPANRTAHMCLAQNIFFEELPYPEDMNEEGARNVDLGMYAVGIATLNRANKNVPYWGGSSICSVVLHDKHGRQFSWTGGTITMQDGPLAWIEWAGVIRTTGTKGQRKAFDWATPRGVENAKLKWARAQEIALEMLDENFVVPEELEHIKDATFFLNPAASSRTGRNWFRTRTRIGPAGNHIFFR